MSKRTPLSRQTSLSSFFKPKESKTETVNQDICSGCGLSASGSCHECFVCKKKGHTFCTYLKNPIEGFKKPILCKDCFEKNDKFASFSEEQVENFRETDVAENSKQSNSSNFF